MSFATPAGPVTRPNRWLLAMVGVGVVAAVAILLYAAVFNRAVPFLAPAPSLAAGRARWIIYPTPVDNGSHYTALLDASFRRTFDVGRPVPPTTLRFCAFQNGWVRINGHLVASTSARQSWKQTHTVDITAALRPGMNQIEAVVANSTGPPALWLAVAWPGGGMGTDGSWESSYAGAATRPACPADRSAVATDVDPFHQAISTGAGLARTWPRLMLFMAIALGGVVMAEGLIRRRAARGIQRRRTWRLIHAGALAAAALAWIALIVHNNPYVPLSVGFDAPQHLQYIQYIRTRQAIPLADQGFEMFQAPLYYLIQARALDLIRASVDDPPAMAVHMVNLLMGLVNLAALMACLRLVFANRPRMQLMGFIVGAFLPVQLYLFHYTTNEVLAVTLDTVAVWLCLRALCTPQPGVKDYLLIGAALGLAMLAKVSALVLFPAAILALLMHGLGRGGRGRLPRTLAHLAALLAAAAVVCGWYYGRVWAHFGTPLVGNWDPITGTRWWQDPGCRGVGHYLRFGRSLRQPLFSGFAGVWDGLYSTLWGDGLCAGQDVYDRAPWSGEMLAAGYLLGLPLTLAALAGAAVAVRRFLARPQPTMAFLLALAATTFLAVIYMTMKIPSYAQAKSIYGLMALVPACVMTAQGLEILAARSRWGRRMTLALLGGWAMFAWGTHWISPQRAQTHTSLAFHASYMGDPAGARTQFEAALALDPADVAARVGLASVMPMTPAQWPHLNALLQLPPGQGDVAPRHSVLGELLRHEGRIDAALREFDLSIQMDPDNHHVRFAQAALLEGQGKREQAIAAYRQVLRINAWDIEAHEHLAALYGAEGRVELARQHLAWAREIQKVADVAK